MSKFIGIDFSLVSPGICIIEPGKPLQLISITRDEHDIEWFLKKKNNPYPIMEEMDNVSVRIFPKLKPPQIYSDAEDFKLKYFMQLTDDIISVLSEYIDPDLDSCYIAMEGISFGSQGNSLIDISMCTSLLRSKLLPFAEDDRIHVYSPGTVKKASGKKGNAKKWEMYDAILETERPHVVHSDFAKSLLVNKDIFVTPKLNVKKPIDDLVDSIWVAYTLADELVGGI